MKPLIIFANPNRQGHCSIILKEVQKKFKKHELLDLYKIKYDPVLKNEEYSADGIKVISKQIKEIQKKIKRASLLIFIYPNWWGSMPAILQGFFDRVLTRGFAYKFVGNFPVGLLKRKKAIVFTTSGSPNLILKLKGNRAKKLIKKDILGFCGIKTKVYGIGSCKKLTERKEKKISKIVKKAFEKI
jgi:NAD(P)H dehydrogenase (quinone)